MELWQIRYFTVVSEVRSIARASVHLRVAGPAISRTIKALEDELGVKLFERDGRGMRLTEAGQTLRERATRLLRDAELARQEVAALGSQLSGEVTIGATPSLIAVVGLPLIRRCREVLPRVRPRIIEGYSSYLRDWVRTGTVDIAFVNGPTPPGPRVTAELLVVERLYALGPPGRLDPWGDGLPLRDLLAEALLLPSGPNPIRSALDEAAASLSLPVSTLLEVDSVGLLKDLVMDGMSLGVLPFGAVRREVEAGAMSAAPIVAPEVRGETHLIYPSDLPPGRVGRAMIRIVRDALAEACLSQNGRAFVQVL